MLQNVYFDDLNQAFIELDKIKGIVSDKALSAAKNVITLFFESNFKPAFFAYDLDDPQEKRGIFVASPILFYDKQSLDTDTFISYNGEVQYTARFDIVCSSEAELVSKVCLFSKAFTEKYKGYSQIKERTLKI